MYIAYQRYSYQWGLLSLHGKSVLLTLNQLQQEALQDHIMPGLLYLSLHILLVPVASHKDKCSIVPVSLINLNTKVEAL